MPHEHLPTESADEGITFHPRGNWIVVDPDKPPERVGLIVIPDAVQEKNTPDTAIVVELGPGAVFADGTRNQMPDVKPGQRVWIVPQTIKHAIKFRAKNGKILAIVGHDAILLVDDATGPGAKAVQ